MTSDHAKKVLERARATLARSQAARERSKASVVANDALTHHLNAQRDLEDRLERYVNGDLSALNYDDAPLSAAVEFTLPKRKRPTKMMDAQEQMNAWFSKSFALHIAPVIEEFNKSNENVRAIFDDLESILELIEKDLESVPVDLANAIAAARISVRKGTFDDLQTSLNVMMRDVEAVLNKKIDSRFRGFRFAIKQMRAASTTDNVTNFAKRKSHE